MSDLVLLVPGPLDQLTGGYLFARRLVDGLRQAGRKIRVVELPGRFPDPDDLACAALAEALAALPDGGVAVIDGLALLAAQDCLAAAARRVRLIGFIHHPLALESGLDEPTRHRFASLEAALIARLHGVLCPSPATARAVAAYGLAASRIAVVPPGTEKPAAIPKRPSLPADRPFEWLCVATVTPRKGHVRLVEALAAEIRPAWRLTCIGSLARDPATAAALRETIARHRLADRVLLAGEWRSERLAAAYRAADGFVLASEHEGYGMAFAEAMAHGLPVVGVAAGAVPDTVPASAGLLVQPGDNAALSGVLGRVMSDPALYRRLAEGASRAGAALPDWPRTTAAWSNACDRLAAENSPNQGI